MKRKCRRPRRNGGEALGLRGPLPVEMRDSSGNLLSPSKPIIEIYPGITYYLVETVSHV
jgi:hypothetical protein